MQKICPTSVLCKRVIWKSGGILNFLFSGRHASLIAGVHCGPGAFCQYRSAIFSYPGRKVVAFSVRCLFNATELSVHCLLCLLKRLSSCQSRRRDSPPPSSARLSNILPPIKKDIATARGPRASEPQRRSALPLPRLLARGYPAGIDASPSECRTNDRRRFGR